MRSINIILLLLCFQFLQAQTLSETQLRNARATGYAIIAAKNPGISFSVFVIPWDGLNTLEYNANAQINPAWHAQAAIKGNFFDQAFDGNDFSTYSTVITSQDEFDLYKSTGTQWWIVCSTLSPFAATIKKNGLEDVVIGQANPIYLSNVWRGYPDAVTNVAEISNDVSGFKQLMIVGNRAQNQDRRVGIWDRLSVSGAPFTQHFNVGGNAFVQGNLGIGIDNPTEKLSIYGVNNSLPAIISLESSREDAQGAEVGTLKVKNSTVDIAGISVGRASGSYTGYMRFLVKPENNLPLIEAFRIKENGNIGIGTTMPMEKLSVNGNVRAKKLIVTQTGWPDYVFEPDYSLKSINDIKKFIKEYKHLPDMPKASEIETNGLNIGEMQASLLKKLEEMTLYIIELKEEIEFLKKKIRQK